MFTKKNTKENKTWIPGSSPRMTDSGEKKIGSQDSTYRSGTTIMSKGFTLIEMMVVIAIFGILTAIVVGNYSKFTNDTILTNMAYEMALSIREAQIYGVAVSNRDTDFDNKFGINFTTATGDGSVFHLFEDSNNDNEYGSSGSCSGIGGDVCQQEYILQRGVKIVDLRTSSNSSVCSNPDVLNIIFDRPNPEPIITCDANLAQITLESPEGTKRYVFVRGNGQIFVDNEPEI